MPATPASTSASFTASSLDGWMTASIFCITLSLFRFPVSLSCFPVVAFFSVLCEIEPFTLIILTDTQANQLINYEQNNQRSDNRNYPGNRNANSLVQKLAVIP